MKRVVVIGIPLLVIGGLVVWRYGIKRASAAQLGAGASQRKNAPANVVLAKAVSRDVDQKLQIVGDAQSPYNVNISPKATGIVEFLTLREGDPVTAGEVLARVDSDEINGQVVQAQAALAEAQQRYTQAKLTQLPTNIGVFTTIDQQRAAVASQEAEYNQSAVNYKALAASADDTVTDAKAKVAAAESQVHSEEAQVQSAQASLDDAQAKYNRTYSLYKQAFVAAQDVDDARTTYEVQKAAVNVAEKALSSAKSALHSAQAEEASAANTASITKLKGTADVQAAKALLTQAKATLKNAASNRAQIPAYEENLRALQSEIDAAKASLAQAQARLTNTTLLSPIDGIITSRTADPGAIANPGTAILQVQYLKWLYIVGAVPVEESSAIHVGMTADIVFDALPTKPFKGTISRINPSADPTNRQFLVYVRLENPDGAIRPGMYSKISLITSVVHADVVVPREAIHAGTSHQPDTVTVVDSTNTAHIVKVKEGVQDTTGVQILDGVEEGQKVVVQAYSPVKDGQKVSSGTGGKGKGKAGGAGASPSDSAASGGAATTGGRS
jgi:HlyD family secretion protein